MASSKVETTITMADALRVVEAWLIAAERDRLRALHKPHMSVAERPPPYVVETPCGSRERRYCPRRPLEDYAYHWWSGTALRKCVECASCSTHTKKCPVLARSRVVRKVRLVRVLLCRGGADRVEYSGAYMCSSCNLTMRKCGSAPSDAAQQSQQ